MQLDQGRMYDVQHLLKKKAYCLTNVNTLYLKLIFLDLCFRIEHNLLPPRGNLSWDTEKTF